jgi:ABC-type phosphate/phosphonate transport system substrate-binding protein
MYDLPDVSVWQTAWWYGLARHFRAAGLPDVPRSLTRASCAAEIWGHPRLLFAQTCGYPLTHGLAGKLRVVATPCYDAPGCAGSDYASAIVVRSDSPARTIADVIGGRCAINETGSQSGCNALRAAVAPYRGVEAPFREQVTTGAHLASIRAVAQGRADACAVDAVTHALLARHRVEALAGTRVLTYTERVPGLPYVTHADADDDVVARLRKGLSAALNDPDLAEVREALLISGAEERETSDYGRILEMERDALARCPALAVEPCAMP